MLVKGDGERISWLRQNQSKLRARYYTQLSGLLPDALNHKNETNQSIGNKESNNKLNVGSLIDLPSNHFGGDRYVRQKMHDIIAISNSIGHPDIS